MSASAYEQMISLVFTAEDTSLQTQLSPLYQELEKALAEAGPGRKSQEHLGFRFERVRLGMGISLMQLLTDLGGDEDSAQVQDLLEEALQAPNTAGIDSTVQQKSHLFAELYTDLYVNHDAEQVLALFEATLDASSKEEMDAIIQDTLHLAEDLELEDRPSGPDSPEA